MTVSTMTLATLRELLMWCTILGGGLFTLAFVILAAAGGWVYRMHSRWFPMPREQWNVAIYVIMGGYKALWIFLCLVPFLALVILTA